MRPNFRLTTALLALAAAPAAAQLAEAPADDASEVRRYTVEVIVFRYAEEVSSGTEIFLPDVIEPIGLPEADDGIPIEPEPDDPPVLTDAELAEGGLPLFQMTVLEESALTLTDIYDRLDRLDVYDPVLHVGWTQTAIEADDTPAIDLREFGLPPPGLDGTFTLYLSRYLHLVVDLAMLAPGESDDPEPRYSDDDRARRFGDDRLNSDLDGDLFAGEPLYGPLRYRISEDRIVRHEELRYYDHPKFGVIAKVLRVEEPEDPTPDDTEFLLPPDSSALGGGQ